MATSSMISSAHIKGRQQVKRFVKALERAEGHRGKSVELTRPVESVSDAALKEIAMLIKV